MISCIEATGKTLSIDFMRQTISPNLRDGFVQLRVKVLVYLASTNLL
jgi:hypothetical protein